METRAKMSELFSSLRQEMNGAVTEAMSDRGLTYPRNYGVSIPVIRRVASDYAPDPELARLLYVQDIRELKIAAFTVEGKAGITLDEMDFWAPGLINYEIAGNFATVLLASSPNLEIISRKWFNSTEDPVIYALLLAGAHRTKRSEGELDWNWEEWLRRIPELIEGRSEQVWHAASAFTERILRFLPESREKVTVLFEIVDSSQEPGLKYLADELRWQLEQYLG